MAEIYSGVKHRTFFFFFVEMLSCDDFFVLVIWLWPSIYLFISLLLECTYAPVFSIEIYINGYHSTSKNKSNGALRFLHRTVNYLKPEQWHVRCSLELIGMSCICCSVCITVLSPISWYSDPCFTVMDLLELGISIFIRWSQHCFHWPATGKQWFQIT